MTSVLAAGGTAAGAIAIMAVPAHAAAAPSPHPVADDITAKIVVAQPEIVTVKAGDYLSKIAAQDCGDQKFWTGILAANKKISNPDLIYPGEKLTLSCKTAPLPRAVVTASAMIPQRHHYYSAPAVTSTYHGSGSMRQCIISRESGGNAGIWNASGHWGLYQFSESTWIAHGGSAADFGHASVAEQNQIYYNTVAQDGYSDWAPYDGC